MNKLIKYLPVNWTNGVKISSEHFFNNYNSLIETIKSYNAINLKSFEYGLLETTHNFVNLELDIFSDGDNSLSIRLKSCNAITEKGYRIVYSKDLYGDFEASTILKTSDFDKTESESFYVVLTISPFEYLPVGTPDPEALPLHHPNVVPKIKMYAVPVSKINTSFLQDYFLVISKVLWVNGIFSLDENYIPPVYNLSSSKKLLNFHKGLVQKIVNIKNYTINIYKKNNKTTQNNSLVINTLTLCNKLQNYYNENVFNLENICPKHSPIYLVNQLVTLANNLSISLSIMNDREKEELLQYYYQWTDVKPSELLDVIVDVVNLKYNHIEITSNFNVLNSFILVLDRIFKKMSELEYIGQRKDNIVINEETRHQLNKNNRAQNNSWSIID